MPSGGVIGVAAAAASCWRDVASLSFMEITAETTPDKTSFMAESWSMIELELPLDLTLRFELVALVTAFGLASCEADGPTLDAAQLDPPKLRVGRPIWEEFLL